MKKPRNGPRRGVRRRSSNPRNERDPDRLWLDHSNCYIEIENGEYVVIDDDERLAIVRGPEVLLQTVLLKYGESTEEGALVKAAAVPWYKIFEEITRNQNFLFEFAQNPRKFEEFIAGTYVEDGWDEVTLTPASGDRGRDVIAVRKGLCAVRVLDQTKAYSAGHLVTHDDVRGIIGVLNIDQNATKGIITTTSDFQPTVFAQSEFKRFIPYRLDLKNGQELVNWLESIRRKRRTFVGSIARMTEARST